MQDRRYAAAQDRAVAAEASADWAEAAQWWERAWRLADRHPLPQLHLASALSRLGDPRAVMHLEAVAARSPSAAVSLALVSALRNAGRKRDAAEALGCFLGAYAAAPLEVVVGLAGALLPSAGRSGWLGWSDDRLLFGTGKWSGLDPAALVLRRNGRRFRPRWTRMGRDLWTAPYSHPRGGASCPPVVASPSLLGSPLDVSGMLRVEGVIEATPSGLRAWAWHPHDPGRVPRLRLQAVRSESLPRTLRPTGPESPNAAYPLAQPWRFDVPLPAALGHVRVLGSTDALLGSPLCRTSWTDLTFQQSQRPPPCYRGPSATRLLVLQDGTSKILGLREAVERPGLEVLHSWTHGGHAEAWNRAARLAPGRDLLLVGPEVRLTFAAVQALAGAAGPAGIAAPLSNGWWSDGYPDPDRPAPLGVDDAGEVAAAADASPAPPVQVGQLRGRVAYVRRQCFDALDGFHEGAFVSAEAVLAEFSHRAACAGYSVAIAPSCFAWDRACGRPTTMLGDAVRSRDGRVLDAAGCGEGGLLSYAASAASLAQVRRGIDARRLEWQLRGRPAVLLVTHDEGGGLERHVQERAAALSVTGWAALLLRSERDGSAIRLELPSRSLPSLRFQVPGDLPELLALLRRLDLRIVKIHHLYRHAEAIRALPSQLGLPYEVALHDYALLCPRVNLIGRAGRYCGEPALEACETCAAEYENTPAVAPEGVGALRRGTFRLLAEAQRILAPSRDLAQRFRHYMPNLRIEVEPWEHVTAPRRLPSAANTRSTITTVCVVGAINRAKGLDVLLECARDARARSLPLRFVIVGHTSDDAALLEAGAFVTGPFAEEERAELIARQGASAGFLPSVWPEPWCYALTGLLQAGLPTLCFDLGAPAERVRAAGGRVVPLGTPAQEINRHLSLTPLSYRK